MTLSVASSYFTSDCNGRLIQHRGVPSAERFHWSRTNVRRIDTVLEPGQTVGDGLAALMRRENCAGGVAHMGGGLLDPCRWYIPAHHPTGELPVWYSNVRDAAGAATFEWASSTLGLANGEPSTHTHGIWRLADGRRFGGHLLPNESVIKQPVSVVAWLSADAGFARKFDAETTFELFAANGGGQGNGVIATLRPNGDLTESIEQLAIACGMRDAQVRGTGSVFDLTAHDGQVHPSDAFEIGIVSGKVVPDGDGVAVRDLALAGVGFDGNPVETKIARGRNRVCVTFELILAPSEA